MKNKLWVLSIIAAVLMILLPVSSVIGQNSIKFNDKKIDSPLFKIKESKSIKSDYLGKGTSLSLFLNKKISYSSSIDKAINFLKRNPVFFNKMLEKIQDHPKINDILESNDISISNFKSYTNSIKNNPRLLEEEIKRIEKYIPEDTTLPLGMNTTNPFAVIILVIAILPIILTIGVMLATMTILTCLNINGCFETLMQNMLDSFVQGLKKPDN